MTDLRATIAVAAMIAAFAPVGPTTAETVQPMQLTTEIPEGIAMPDAVETRLGTLRFFDGFPDADTTQILYDNLDFQRAVQAYMLALPALNMAGLREGLLTRGPANTTIPTFETMMDSRSIFLTANANTAYTWIWIDLTEGPLVAEVPPGTLGMVDAFWFRYVTDIGMLGPDKGAGGRYLLVPPGHEGELPDGYLVVEVPTYESIFVWRNLPVDGDIAPTIETLQAVTRLYPMSEADNPPANTFVNTSGMEFNTVAPADYRFWELLNDVVQSEPVDSIDPVTLGFLASIGIERGRPFAPDERMQAILTEAAVMGDVTGVVAQLRPEA